MSKPRVILKIYDDKTGKLVYVLYDSGLLKTVGPDGKF